VVCLLGFVLWKRRQAKLQAAQDTYNWSENQSTNVTKLSNPGSGGSV